MPDLLTVKQASEQTGVNELTIRSRMNRGAGPFMRVDGVVMLTRAQVQAIVTMFNMVVPDGFLSVQEVANRTGLTESGVLARAKIMGLTATKCHGKRLAYYYSPAQAEAIRGFVKTRPSGTRAGWRKHLPENHGVQRHGTAADASIAMCRTRKTMDPLAVLRRVAASLPSEVPNHGVTRCDIENSIIHDVRELLARDARERNNKEE